MKITRVHASIALLLFLFVPLLSYGEVASEREATARLQGISVPFVANEGQVDGNISLYAGTFAGTVFVTRSGAIRYAFPSGGRLSETVKDGPPSVAPEARGRKPGYLHIVSNDPTRETVRVKLSGRGR
jgi:hypothetical protein